jgi:hypothetical protein
LDNQVKHSSSSEMSSVGGAAPTSPQDENANSLHGSAVPGHPERQSPTAAYRQALCDAQRAIVEACGMCDGAGFVVMTATTDGHQCDGTDEMCSQVCPVPVPHEVAEPCEYCQRPVGAIAALERAMDEATSGDEPGPIQPKQSQSLVGAAPTSTPLDARQAGRREAIGWLMAQDYRPSPDEIEAWLLAASPASALATGEKR